MTQMSGVNGAPPAANVAAGAPDGPAFGVVLKWDGSLPAPMPGLDATAQMEMSLEAILMLTQAADTDLTKAKSAKTEQDAIDRKQKLDKMLAEMKEQAEKKNSPGFFGSIVKVVKDFAKDLVTNPAKIGKDLGSNIKAALDSPNFWGDLKKICMKVVEVAAIAASAVATVFSAGAASIAVAGVILAISALNFAQSEFNIAKAVGLPPKLAAGIQLGLAVVAIALSFGTNTGAVVGAARAVKEVSTGLQVAGTAVGGVATVADARIQADALDRQARIKSLQSGMEALTEAIKGLIDDIQEHKENGQAVTKNILATIDQQNQTTNSLTAMKA